MTSASPAAQEQAKVDQYTKFELFMFDLCLLLLWLQNAVMSWRVKQSMYNAFLVEERMCCPEDYVIGFDSMITYGATQEMRHVYSVNFP